MAWLSDQILTLLASEAGSLAYHLVLAFSIAGALQVAISLRIGFTSPLIRRVLLGLTLLLFFQILLFIISGMVWKGMLDGRILLPFVDRAIALFSLLIIIWLWAFPNPDSMIDASFIIIGFFVFVGAFFLAIWWSRQGLSTVPSGLQPNGYPAELAINGSPMDILFQTVASIAAVLGAIILFIKRPAGWGIGLSMILILAAGLVLNLLLLPGSGDYPTIVRLIQMAAYPLLLFLPLRAEIQMGFETSMQEEDRSTELDVQVEPSEPEKTSEQELSIYTQIFKPLLGLMDNLSAEQTCKRVVAYLVEIARADYGFLVSPSDAEGQLQVHCGYDNLSNRYFDPMAIEASSLPILSSCFSLGRVRRLQSSSASPDRLSLGRLFNLDQMGAMLFVPVLSHGGSPLAGAILVTAETDRDWSIEEQSTIGLLAKFLILYLERTKSAAERESELMQARQASRQIQGRIQQFFEEDQKLRDKINVLEERVRLDQEQISVMSALVVDQESLRKEVVLLRAENEKLGEAIDQAVSEAANRKEPLAGELRLALEEISLLRSAVTHAEGRISDIDVTKEGAGPSKSQLVEIRTISQDLRQPLATMIGYVDVLLGESVGILGSNQRKYLERIKVSTERFGHILEELVQASLVESESTSIQNQTFDLRQLIEEASNEAIKSFQHRSISLQTNLPEKPLMINTDRENLQEVITLLVRNAGSVTNEREVVEVTALIESSETEPDYFLIQVADKGGGIPTQDLTRVFSSLPSGTVIEGLGEPGIEFVRIKALIEALGGRIWVDSEPGVGSVFSVLLPALTISEDESNSNPAGVN